MPTQIIPTTREHYQLIYTHRLQLVRRRLLDYKDLISVGTTTLHGQGLHRGGVKCSTMYNENEMLHDILIYGYDNIYLPCHNTTRLHCLRSCREGCVGVGVGGSTMSSSILHATPQAEKNLKKLHMTQTDTKTMISAQNHPEGWHKFNCKQRRKIRT